MRELGQMAIQLVQRGLKNTAERVTLRLLSARDDPMKDRRGSGIEPIFHEVDDHVAEFEAVGDQVGVRRLADDLHEQIENMLNEIDG